MMFYINVSVFINNKFEVYLKLTKKYFYPPSAFPLPVPFHWSQSPGT